MAIVTREATGHSVDTGLFPAYKYTKLSADGLVKTGGGVLHSITFTCDDAAPTAGTFILFDNTAESGDQIFEHTFTTTPFAPTTVVLDTVFFIGLYAGFTTTADVNATITYA